MRSNFHQIKAFIHNIHEYSETIYGAAGYTMGLFKINTIKIKNSIKAVLLMFFKLRENEIRINNNPVDANLGINGKLEKEPIYVENKLRAYLISKLNAFEPSNIQVVNSLVLFIAKVLKCEQELAINNSLSHSVNIKSASEKNDIYIGDSVKTITDINVESENQTIQVDNPNVNASSWYFVRLEAMSGSLNAYYNQTIENTSRKKVV